MNRLDVNQVGGFPMTTRILDEVQKAHAIFNALGNIAGELTIISGCEVIGANVNDGFVFISGELFEFRGGSVQTKVIIKEEVESLVFQSGTAHPVIKTRYATFGTAVESWNWVDFKRPIQVKVIPTDLVSTLNTISLKLAVLEKKNAVFQSGGGMLFWNKPANQIPAGWQEVVDWRGRIPAGLDVNQPEFNILGKTGGAKSKTLSIAEMPTHSVTYKDVYYAENGGTVPLPGNFGSGRSDNDNLGYELTRTSDPIGGGQSFSMLNPYRVVLFIEYIE